MAIDIAIYLFEKKNCPCSRAICSLLVCQTEYTYKATQIKPIMMMINEESTKWRNDGKISEMNLP